ncbi:tRNA preQ1(34) S-adenosylmethionine ribosyltransferase-isomerase QueA [Anaeromassilibacillus sp. An172]|uniref:tRNA preQ1(34) S-adenosylmethionine ribosyltransferase-isomerase QueA n=1 Tax=Anaeromassilibacillus sp. An172 TaxID=1965570 RepID=UPI000B39B45A|nr:tRNA preQ1(34) S-adenosylmethionine ribosyltransferase-isomerase QueA [Anaeromassilibacillus sp. An172]OUP79555.1 tRNA preQ1(34) S-adenosylmethionine ribosyltransferase-isomerase QueA [Anaeromassilibacillus sp. An172]
MTLKNKTSDYFYELPEELIAQTPVEPRDHSSMLVLDRETGKTQHKHFYDVSDYLKPGDCLILNDSRVLPARIFGTKKDTGAHVEFLLLKCVGNNRWETLVKPGRKAKVGAEFVFSPGVLEGKITDVLEDGNRIIDFSCEGNFYTILEELGKMPLPPYITAELKDQERYQTVYSHELGSAAAPTAGLHFTKELLKKIEEKGVKIGYVTLHVGLGTFRPVKAENITEHKMHSEHYHLPKETADLINETKKNGGRVIAVGTTSCRTLESVATFNDGKILESDGWTSIFIYPGYEFKVLDGLITNFHLPESTLIMLVSAFAGYEHVMAAYKEAVEKRYRFFSFGDAMLII